MIDLIADEWIEKEARRILIEIKEANAFGRKINPDDQNQLIVAAYYFGRKEEMDAHTSISGI